MVGWVASRTATSPVSALPDARQVLRKLGMVSRSRRPTMDELDKLLGHFQGIQKLQPSSINMLKVVGFAIFSTRSEEEICRVRWNGNPP
jgi:hypothetical protein